MPSPQTVPHSWVADLFLAFTRLYGAQRMAVMYPDAELQATVAMWAAELGKHSRDAVAAAIADLPNRERAWPPTLSEFIAIVVERKPAPEHRRALPVPARTAEQIAAGREHMDAIKALLGRRGGRRGVAEREPGCDDEPPAPLPSCTCFVGLVRSETLCPACASFRRNRATMDSLRDGTAQELADELRKAA